MKNLRNFVVALVLFPVTLGAQEVTHLAVYSFFHVPATLIVTPWRFQLVDLWVFGLHAEAGVTPSVPVHIASDALGPALPGLSLLVLWLAVRSAPAARAVLANVLVLFFFSLLELVFAIGEFALHQNMDVLLWPELNFGPVLLILVLTVWWPFQPRRAGRSLDLWVPGEHGA
jgi:hypothetical protein